MPDNNKEIAIKVEHLSKSFKIPLEKSNGLKQKLINTLKGKKGYRLFTPLNDISFEIEKGDFFGIVGRNGSGKSTLLKSIAGIYTPNKGSVHVNGKLVPFIELGVGFNAELSGRENVFLNGALLGFSRNEMEEMYDDIVDFAELEDFMDESLKNYSSGMQVRLAFSIAIRAKGDVLLLDEVLAVGDAAFQQKCYSYFHRLKEEKKTVVLVTHSMSAVERFCNKALLLDGGEVKKIGDKVEIAELYNELFINSKNKKDVQPVADDKSKLWQADVSAAIFTRGIKSDAVRAHEEFSVNIKLKSKVNLVAGNIGLNIRNEGKLMIFSMDTRSHIGEIKLNKGEAFEININIQNRYTNGGYLLGVHLVDESKEVDSILYMNKSILEFTSDGVTSHPHSLFHPEYNVEIIG